MRIDHLVGDGTRQNKSNPREIERQHPHTNTYLKRTWYALQDDGIDGVCGKRKWVVCKIGG